MQICNGGGQIKQPMKEQPCDYVLEKRVTAVLKVQFLIREGCFNFDSVESDAKKL